MSGLKSSLDSISNRNQEYMISGVNSGKIRA
jgi:hypothetical protein